MISSVVSWPGSECYRILLTSSWMRSLSLLVYLIYPIRALYSWSKDSALAFDLVISDSFSLTVFDNLVSTSAFKFFSEEL